MNSPAIIFNRQLSAQKPSSFAMGCCDTGLVWQARSQAEGVSLRSAMVLTNHYPSPSLTRFLRFGAEPSLFSHRTHQVWAKTGCCVKFCFGLLRKPGKLFFIKKKNRGSQKCNSQSFAPSLRPSLCWPGASGTTFSAPVWVRQRVLLSPKQPAATFLPERSSGQARVRFAMMSVCRLVTDVTSVLRGCQSFHKPAGPVSGGFFYAKLRGGAACCVST